MTADKSTHCLNNNTFTLTSFLFVINLSFISHVYQYKITDLDHCQQNHMSAAVYGAYIYSHMLHSVQEC